MLGASVKEQILSRGQGWPSVSSRDASKGSRLEKIVARLCRCGITTVMQSRRLRGRYEKPRQRGVKRAVADSESDDSSNAGAEDEVADLWPDVSQGLEQASLQPTPKMQEVGGVRGRYLPQALLQPQEHAIAITMGRIIIWGTVNAIPQRTLEGLMAQMSLANAALGEKYHGRWFAPPHHRVGGDRIPRLVPVPKSPPVWPRQVQPPEATATALASRTAEADLRREQAEERYPSRA